MRPIMILTTAALVLLVPSLGWAAGTGSIPIQRSDSRENLRETCRKLVAGAYLNAYDEKIQAEQYLKVVRAKTERLTRMIAAEKKRLIAAKAKESKTEFKVGEATARDIIEGQIATMETDLKANQDLVGEAEKRIELKRQDEAAKKSRLMPVFKLIEVSLADKARMGAYPFRVDYTTTCPKFRVQCPLPPAHSKVLKSKEMFGGEDPPEACARYASIGQN